MRNGVAKTVCRKTHWQRRVITFVFVLASAFCGQHAFAISPEASVVKIIAGNNTGTGFVWLGADRKKYIVTSLHTLAGTQNIFYQKISRETQLQVSKVDFESDLALLLPVSGSLPHPALKATNAFPDVNAKYYIWGYPAGVKLIQADSIEFSVAQHKVEMKDLLSNAVLKDVTESGFPKETLKILRVSSGITPGHSGAPIIDVSTQSVIGIGAGGLSKKGFRRVNWAVPAADYLQAIQARGQYVDVSRLDVSNSELQHAVRGQQAHETVQANQSKYYHIYRVTMKELIDSLYSGEFDHLARLASRKKLEKYYEHARSYGYDLESVQVDIYQNVETGSTVYLPASAVLGTQGDIVLAKDSGRGFAGVFFTISNTQSIEQADAARVHFEYTVNQATGGRWVLNTEESFSSPHHDEDKGHWENWLIYQRVEESNESSELELNVSFDYGEGYANFFGYALVGIEDSDHSVEESQFMHQLSICIELSGFALI